MRQFIEYDRGKLWWGFPDSRRQGLAMRKWETAEELAAFLL